MRIATLGPKGTFSEEAALIYQQRMTGRTEPEKIDFSAFPNACSALSHILLSGRFCLQKTWLTVLSALLLIP